MSGFIGALGDYARTALAVALILATGYAILWAGTRLGNWLTLGVPSTYLVPAIGLVFPVRYLAPLARGSHSAPRYPRVDVCCQLARSPFTGANLLH